MSKKNSVQEKHRQQRKERLAAERAIQKQKNIKKGSIIAISSAVAVALVITAIVIGVAKYRETNAYKTGVVPITCGDNSVDLAMLEYYYYDGVYGLLDLYGEELEKNGIRPDPSKSLNDQYNGESSWHDYFIDSALGQITQNLILAQAAKDEGIAITESEESALSAKADRMDLSRYGKGVTKNDVLKCLRLDYIAIKYEYTKRSADTMSEDELTEYYDKYYKHFSTVDFRCLEVPYSDAYDMDSAEKYANAVVKNPTDDGFTQGIRDNVLLINPELTAENVEQIVSSSYVTKQSYSEGDIMSEWLFDAERKPYDVKVYHNEATKSFTAYMLTKVAEKDMLDTVTLRHILFRPETYGSEDAALEKAKQVLELWKNDGATEEAFKNYAISYSEDAATCYLGGLYENVTSEELLSYLSAFKEWGFSSDRVKGDFEIIRSDFGFHIIYYVDKGLPSALGRTQKTVSSENFGELFTSLQTKYKVNTDESKLSKFNP